MLVVRAGTKNVVTPDRLKALVLGKTRESDEGQMTRLIDLPESSQAYKDFYKSLTQKSLSKVKANLHCMIFTGKRGYFSVHVSLA